MGKQVVKIGKSLKDQDASDEDLGIKDLCLLPKKGSTTHMGGTRQFRKTVNVKDSKSVKQVKPDMNERQDKAGLSLAAKDESGKRLEKHVDDLKIPMNERKKSQLAGSTMPTKQEVKEDFVKEEAVKTKEAFINMIIGSILMLALVFGIKSFFSHMAAKFSTKYKSYPMRTAVISPGKVHQLFLNFRGEQLRYNFVSHLSDAFQRHEINFFIDKYEQRGKDLKHLFVRIEESSIALAIFSTRYPESTWCMDELAKMKKLADQGKLRVIPIFYKVDAEDVRKPTGDSEFGKNFWRLAESSSGDQIKKWKEALECISYKMGLSFGDKSSESDFVKEIVKEVQRVIESIGLQEEEKPFLGFLRLHR